MKKINLIFAFVFALIAVNSCSTLKIAEQETNSSIIAISATTSGALQKGYGIIITLYNIDTQQLYKSKSLSPMSPHSVIKNLPTGKYFVQKIEIPLGRIMYLNWSDDVKNFFGEIIIEPNKKYYLGNFTGTRDIGRKNVLKLRLNNTEIPEKLKDQIEKGWKEGEFIKRYPEKEELMIY